MSEISGRNNEYEFVKYLNNKKIRELNPMFRDMIDELFKKPNDNFIIKAWLNKFPQKSDFFIKINDKMKGISVKKGNKNSVHVEGISQFIHFLILNNVPRNIIISYLKYHYADGTTNGKGVKRMSAEEYKIHHQQEIDEMNIAFNQEKLLKEAIQRFVLKGNNSNYYIDAIITGEVNDFLWASFQDVENIILSKKDIYSTAVHFGSLTCQPKNRCLNYNKKYEKDRFCVQLKWYNLQDDIIEFMNEKCFSNKS